MVIDSAFISTVLTNILLQHLNLGKFNYLVYINQYSTYKKCYDLVFTSLNIGGDVWSAYSNIIKQRAFSLPSFYKHCTNDMLDSNIHNQRYHKVLRFLYHQYTTYKRQCKDGDAHFTFSDTPSAYYKHHIEQIHSPRNA